MRGAQIAQATICRCLVTCALVQPHSISKVGNEFSSVSHDFAVSQKSHTPLRYTAGNRRRLNVIAEVHAGYRSVTRTARLKGKRPFDAIRDLIDCAVAVA